MARWERLWERFAEGTAPPPPDYWLIQFKDRGVTSGIVEVIEIELQDHETPEEVGREQFPSIVDAIKSLEDELRSKPEHIDLIMRDWEDEIVSGEEDTIHVDPSDSQYPVDIEARWEPKY